MKSFILFLTVIVCCFCGHAQQRCPQHSRLYTFYKGNEPRLFTDTLGRRPEFPFLQRINGVTSRESFIKAIHDPANQRKYAREFKAFDLLLRNSGFTHGYRDLHLHSVSRVYISAGTIGNLGFYNKEKDVINYEYVILSPAGEDPAGTSAWKLTNASGCFLYILHTCGNGFYPNESAGGGVCCKTVSVKPVFTPPVQQSDSVDRPVQLTINSYEAQVVPAREKGKKYDTLVKLIRSKDTLVYFRDKKLVSWTADPDDHPRQIQVCRDSVIQLNIKLVADPLQQTDAVTPFRYQLADTVFKKETPKPENSCHTNWEISADAGGMFNTVPRLDDPLQHTQANGSHLTAELAISRILSPWFQLGVSASYMTLSYQDDIVYPGTVPDTYNKIYLGKPVVPVQLFGKFTIGKPVGFQSNISLSLGYSIPTNGKIENGGNTLTTQPHMKGDFTAGLKLGVAYFFSCHFGLGVSFAGQYFNNKGDLMNYSIFALPVTGGIRVRL